MHKNQKRKSRKIGIYECDLNVVYICLKYTEKRPKNPLIVFEFQQLNGSAERPITTESNQIKWDTVKFIDTHAHTHTQITWKMMFKTKRMTMIINK